VPCSLNLRPLTHTDEQLLMVSKQGLKLKNSIFSNRNILCGPGCVHLQSLLHFGWELKHKPTPGRNDPPPFGRSRNFFLNRIILLGVGNTAAYQPPSHLCTICEATFMTHCSNIFVALSRRFLFISYFIFFHIILRMNYEIIGIFL